MQAYSAGYAAAYASGGWTYASQILLRGPNGGTIYNSAAPSDSPNALQVVSGDVGVDSSAAIQRSLNNLVLVDETGAIVPDLPADAFSAVSGNELVVYAGFVVAGVAELKQLGVFVLEGAQTEDSPGGFTVSISAFDRAYRVARARYSAPSSVPNNTNAATAIQQILAAQAPFAITYDPDNPTTTFTVPYQLIEENTDPWQLCIEIAASAGWEIYFDYLGRVAWRTVPDPDTISSSPFWVYREGETSTLVKTSRASSNQDSFNGQILTGESLYGISPARAEVWDTDPTSITYYLGPYGKVPDFFTDSKVQTNAQALEAATARFNKRKHLRETVTFDVIPNPVHDPYDVVQVVRARSKLNDLFVMDKFSVPLAAAGGPTMPITARQRSL